MFWRKTPPPPLVIDHDRAKRAIVQVGQYGRGFMCHQNIVTVVSCLPRLPAFNPFAPEHSFEFKSILGRLGESPSISATCEFADIISNVAVLREIPLDYGRHQLVNWEVSYRIGEPRKPRVAGGPVHQDVWILSPEATWIKCRAENSGLGIHISNVPFELDRQSSGSPIVDEEGTAIGIVCAPVRQGLRYAWGDPHPVTSWCLPGWLVR
jgi:hypothetical protein